MGRMTNGSGGGFIAEQRRMQFMLGMTHLQHQLGEASADAGLERQKALYSHQKEVDHGFSTQAKDKDWEIESQRMILGSGLKQEEMSHASNLKTEEADKMVDIDKRRAQNENNATLSLERRRGQLPLTRQEKYQAAQQRRHDDATIARAEEITQREREKTERERANSEAMQPMVDKVMEMLSTTMGGGPASQGAQEPQPQQTRTTMPRYGSSGGGWSSEVPTRASRRIRNKARGK